MLAQTANLPFLPREAPMIARSWDRNSVRPSVRLSVRLSHACFMTKIKNIRLKFLDHMKE